MLSLITIILYTKYWYRQLVRRNFMNLIFIFKNLRFLILPILTLSLLFVVGEQPEIIQAASREDNNYYRKPSKRPISMGMGIGIWLSGGFNINPKPDTSGNELSIVTNSVRSTASFTENPFEPLTHTWYQRKEDDPSWSQVPNSNSSSLKVKTNQLGTTYYQLHDHYRVIFTSENYYSNVAAVHVTSRDVPAKSLTVNVDTNYIYNSTNTFNNDTAFANATPDPQNSTEEVTWSVSDPSLATIDSNGKITAVPGKEGSFFVKGTIINKDGTEASDTKLMNVGGGLFDQKVRAGQRVTFSIQGFDNATRDNDYNNIKVQWYKKSKDDKQTTALSTPTNPFEYTTDITSSKDDGEKYYAIIKLKNKELRTSYGLLTVLPALDSKVVLTDKQKNTSFKNETDTDNYLNNVVNGDIIEYTMNLNNNSNHNLLNTHLKTYLSLGTEINSITIDGKLTTDYESISNTNNSNKLIDIDVNELKMGAHHQVVINTLTRGIKKEMEFASTPSFTGTDSENNSYQGIGSKLHLKYITNQIIPHIKDIQFESIYSFENKGLKYRTSDTNSPNNVISIDDERRKKNPVKFYLNQPKPFLKDGKIPLAATLDFCRNGIIYPLTNKFLIADSNEDQTFQSINWNKDEGLLLQLNGTNSTAGKYQTTLSWNIEDTI